MENNNFEVKDNNFEEVSIIVNEIISSNSIFIEKIHELIKKNEFLRNSVNNYFSGMDAFRDFTFQCWDTSSVGKGKEKLFSTFDSDLNSIISNNKDRNISINALNNIKNSFEERTNLIVESLSKEFLDQDDANKETERIYKEFILPVLNTEKVFC